MESNLWVDYLIQRGAVSSKLRKSIGLLMTVKAHPDLERYMENMANGRTVGADAYGPMWVSANDEPLNVYILDQNLDTSNYSFSYVGSRMLPNIGGANPDGGGGLRLGGGGRQLNESLVNLSILTLVGISRPEGVTFGVEGAYSADYIRGLRNALPAATKQFLQDYIVPMTINLQLISKE